MGAVLDGAVERLHATAIAVGNRAVLIRGISGSGKSDLALRCLATQGSPFAKGPAKLVADDQVMIMRQDTRLIAYAPETLVGKMEVRGLGIIEVETVQDVDIALVAEITPKDAIARYPDPWPMLPLLGLRIPVLRVAAFEASAPLKILAALQSPALPAITPDDAEEAVNPGTRLGK